MCTERKVRHMHEESKTGGHASNTGSSQSSYWGYKSMVKEVRILANLPTIFDLEKVAEEKDVSVAASINKN